MNMERPEFANVAAGPRVPLRLSDKDDQLIIEVPDIINRYLREYQREGIMFLYQHYTNNSGALLADDMGLGKTIQVISLMAAILKKTGKRDVDEWHNMPDFIRRMEGDKVEKRQPFLIIGPASVLYNWKNELDIWGYFNIGLYHGSEKSKVLADLNHDRLDVVITTYETCREHINNLSDVKWAAIFADEVHKIKTEKAEVRVALKRFKCKKRFGLTGTPLQNRLMELWCIMDWANPSCFGDMESFDRKFVRSIEEGQRQEATKRELAEARAAQIQLTNQQSHYMLRRTKALIADQLPKKEELVVYCKPSDLQLSVYRSILEEPDLQFILKQNQPCNCLSGRVRRKCHYKVSSSGMSVKSLIMIYMHMLLKTANHVALISAHGSEASNRNQYRRSLCSKLFRRHPQLSKLCDSPTMIASPEYSGKLQILRGLLSVFWNQKSKVLLFSYSTKILDILETLVVDDGYRFTRLDGTVTGVERMRRVDEFNSNPAIFIFLISTKAGGIGLNLTGADVVIIYDPNWNPTHDLQAQDRAYRLGQKRDVRIYRLITSGMIEETIYLKQICKQQLHSATVERQNARRLFTSSMVGGAGNKSKGQLKKGELSGVENLFNLVTDERCRTENILLRNEQMEAELRGYQMSHYTGQQQTTGVSHSTYKSMDDDNGGSDIEYSDDKYNEDIISEFSDDSPDNSSNDDVESLSDDDDNNIMMKPSTAAQRTSILEFPTSYAAGRARTSAAVEVSGRKIRLARTREDTPVTTSEESCSGGKRSKLCDEMPSEVINQYQSVSEVLGQDYVVHMHRNHLLVGGSRAEDHMTRCALQDVYELNQNSQLPAALCDRLSQNEDVPSAIVPKQYKVSANQKTGDNLNESYVKVIAGTRVLIGQTPPTIQRQQFNEMIKYFQASNPREFAERIMSTNKSERKQLLKEYYTAVYPHLKPALSPHKHDNKVGPKGDKTESLVRSGVTSNSCRIGTKGRRQSVENSSSVPVSSRCKNGGKGSDVAGDSTEKQNIAATDQRGKRLQPGSRYYYQKNFTWLKDQEKSSVDRCVRSGCEQRESSNTESKNTETNSCRSSTNQNNPELFGDLSTMVDDFFDFNKSSQIQTFCRNDSRDSSASGEEFRSVIDTMIDDRTKPGRTGLESVRGGAEPVRAGLELVRIGLEPVRTGLECTSLSLVGSFVDDILNEPKIGHFKSAPKHKAARTQSKSVFADLLDTS